MLFVIFVFALLPAGFSQTRLVGSAFDPSSSVVSLKESSRQPEERKTAAQPDGEPDTAAVTGADRAALPVAPAAHIGPFAARRDRPILLPLQAEPPEGQPASAFRARAPPLA